VCLVVPCPWCTCIVYVPWCAGGLDVAAVLTGLVQSGDRADWVSSEWHGVLAGLVQSGMECGQVGRVSCVVLSCDGRSPCERSSQVGHLSPSISDAQE
jgi:hypothetical protein